MSADESWESLGMDFWLERLFSKLDIKAKDVKLRALVRGFAIYHGVLSLLFKIAWVEAVLR